MKNEFWSAFFSILILQCIMFSISSFIIEGLYPDLTGFVRIIAYTFVMTVIMMIIYLLLTSFNKEDGE